MSLTAAGDQLPWHDPGAAESAKCCCTVEDPLCETGQMIESQEQWLGNDWICELTPAQYAGLVAGGTWRLQISGSKTETGSKFGGAWTGNSTLSLDESVTRSGCNQKHDFTGSCSEVYSWVPSGPTSITSSFTVRMQHIIGKYVAGTGTPLDWAKPYGLRMGNATTGWPVGRSGSSIGAGWTAMSLFPQDISYDEEWNPLPVNPAVSHPFFRGDWTGNWNTWPSAGTRFFTPWNIGSYDLSETFSVAWTWTASAP